MKRARPVALIVVTAVLAVVTLAGCSGEAARTKPARTASAVPTVSSTATSPASTSSLTQAWPGYHDNSARTGAVATSPPANPAGVVWSANLGGAVYGQPVVADDHVIVATETNRIVALAPATGAVEWSVSIGAPLTNVRAAAGCGDIDPLGITSTPAIDERSGTVYVVGEVDDEGGVHHQLVGIRISTGKVTLSENVDPQLPAGQSPVNLLQRASLALANGRVYISYGGNDGDCGSYHGWVVGVEQSGAPRMVAFEVASDGEGGAIWESGGAPAVDGHGNLYVSTGNANPDPPEGGPDPKMYTESVVKLTPDLTVLASFKDTIAGGDEDLATGNPVLLPNGQVFAVGKTDVGYILDAGNLAEIASIDGICGSDPDGGPAYDAASDRVFVPCRDGGIQQVNLSDGTLGRRLPGANGAPIVIGTTLWAAEYPQGTLSEFSIPTGAPIQRIPIRSSIPFFSSPSFALGRIFMGTDTGVAAIAGAAG